ncbi:MAG: PEP-CTERM sorting domain-containing protein [Cyanomargarita calcarea GSE-NOS-MK-12-04C]|uniref:PEP-CTERM sorting domain-containing protein n=1 Tax=Cyanomargarita calcarea GSE-NOS-MK-12-04C TaxID=2839659 RepID=A0A951URJ2_9CYAN|nr:PEP-CTERM sorting domain-containing protein [Cyanomargarita calcarea GSE-NOS-MK-12-04C]
MLAFNYQASKFYVPINQKLNILLEDWMTKYLGFTKQFSLITTSMLASCVLAISPSRAATFASSDGKFALINFSQSASTVSTGTEANALAIGNGGMVAALAESQAFFVQPPLVGFNSSLSQVFGENKDYLGEAISEATLIGLFDVAEKTTFSFDFAGILNLSTSIDEPSVENARASGEISFALFDISKNSILDFFSLAGNLITKGDKDFIAYQKSDNVTLNNPVIQSNFGGKQESATAIVEGSFKSTFEKQTNLALIEVKRNRVRVSTPEPSTYLALLLSSGVIAVALKRKRQLF